MSVTIIYKINNKIKSIVVNSTKLNATIQHLRLQGASIEDIIIAYTSIRSEYTYT